MKESAIRLGAAWRDAWRALAVPADEALLHSILARYEEPRRSYHNTRHLRECLVCLEELRESSENPAEIILALFFHDAIYDTAAKDNEARSAEWARASLLEKGVSAGIAERVHGLVMATRHGAGPHAGDAAVIIDADLGILGASRERFDEYERQIREEYARVPEPVFRVERRKVLEGFLIRDSIYQTPLFRELREATARENLARSIAALP